MSTSPEKPVTDIFCEPLHPGTKEYQTSFSPNGASNVELTSVPA